MTIIVVGYIKDFEKNLSSFTESADQVLVVEGVSERIDYIRANNLEQKESFRLIPKFVTNAVETGKQITIFIQKIDILSSLRKKRKVVQFGQVQSTPFFDSRQILVTTQKLKDLFPIDTLIINWGSTRDTLSYLESAESYIYNIETIFIHQSLFSDELFTFLDKVHFQPSNDIIENNNYIKFSNNKPNIKTLIFKDTWGVLEVEQTDSSDIFAIDWGTGIHIPFAKFFPCKDSVIYFSSKFRSERIKNTVLFGNVGTMIRLAKVIEDKRILFLDTLKNEGFILNEF